MDYSVKEILSLEVAPALGCTEPVAIALGAAAAAALLPDAEIDRAVIRVDPNIYKNGLAVTIPGAEGASGLDMAAALGICGGDPAKRLEVLESIDEKALSRARNMLTQGRVEVEILPDHRGLRIETRLEVGGRTAESVITDVHDNIIRLVLDGQEIPGHPLLKKTAGGGDSLAGLEQWLRERTVADLVELADQLDEEDLDFLAEGVETNLRLAEYGLKHGSGLGVGLALERLVREGLLKKDIIQEARILTSAAADARMSGARLPAMSSAGSGNHGLTAVLPVWSVGPHIAGVDRQAILKAIGLSHIVTGYIKAHTGRLSAVCGCSIAAGAGATAGVTWLMGGSINCISGAIKNLIVDLAGIICDGAKASCALKLATAAGAAVQAALFSLHGVVVSATDGIVGLSPEQTTRNIGELSTQGMIETDRTILKIMMEKRLSS